MKKSSIVIAGGGSTFTPVLDYYIAMRLIKNKN